MQHRSQTFPDAFATVEVGLGSPSYHCSLGAIRRILGLGMPSLTTPRVSLHELSQFPLLGFIAQQRSQTLPELLV